MCLELIEFFVKSWDRFADRSTDNDPRCGAFVFTLIELGGGWYIQRDFMEGKFSPGRGNPDLAVDCTRPNMQLVV